jgi:ATP-dependent DNA ligase
MVRSLDQWRRGETTTLPALMKPQLTKLIGEPPDGPEWLHEIKFDGYRMHARLDRGAVRLLTRTGLDWTHKYRGDRRGALAGSVLAERASIACWASTSL